MIKNIITKQAMFLSFSIFNAIFCADINKYLQDGLRYLGEHSSIVCKSESEVRTTYYLALAKCNFFNALECSVGKDNFYEVSQYLNLCDLTHDELTKLIKLKEANKRALSY